MRQNAFKEVLQRYLNGSSTPKEKKLVEEWFEAIGKGHDQRLSEEEEAELFNCYEKDLKKIYFTKDVKTLPIFSRSSVWVKAAAVVFIILTALLYVYTNHVREAGTDLAVNGQHLIHRKVVNTQVSAMTVVLSDRSEVVLNPGAVITFKTDFESAIREVSLAGEAFFNVRRDSLRPFVVKTGDLMTRVLGTSFTVKANLSDDNVTVTVKTGKVVLQPVSSEAAKSIAEEILTPNQQAVYNIKDRTFLKKELEGHAPAQQQGNAQRYRFNEAPVKEILRALESAHRTRIVFEENAFRGCLLSTSISANENIFRRLDIICKAIGATYTVDGVSVHITGKSCDTVDQ